MDVAEKIKKLKRKKYKMAEEKARSVFIYLAFIAIILGAFGIFILINDFTGQIVGSGEKYTSQEIFNHNSEADCWIYSGEMVYDITLFLQISDELKGNCGKEVSLDEELKKVLESYQIGIVK